MPNKIISSITSRLTEASTYAGLAAIVTGVGQIGKINEAPAIADALYNVSTPMQNGDFLTAITIFFGAIAVWIREKVK